MAVKGKIKIFVDGGVRSGVDVLKMLALGAEAVLVGRPMAVAAVGGGKEGVVLSAEPVSGSATDGYDLRGVQVVGRNYPFCFIQTWKERAR